MQQWGQDRAPELADLVASALPDEHLSVDELQSCLWDDPHGDGVVIAPSDGTGAVSVVARSFGEQRIGFLKLLAVAPAAQAAGLGRALLAAGEAWAFDEAGCAELHAGGSAPFYLWPGIDLRWTRALCLFEAHGYRATGAEINMRCPVTYTAAPPDGTRVGRVLEDVDAEAVVAFCAEHFPHWVPELERGAEHGACFGAWDDTGVLGFACHSVNRTAWLGPMATHPGRRRAGVGAALLAAVCADVRSASRADLEIAWVGPVGFYARAAGATVSRVYRLAVKRRPA